MTTVRRAFGRNCWEPKNHREIKIISKKPDKKIHNNMLKIDPMK